MKDSYAGIYTYIHTHTYLHIYIYVYINYLSKRQWTWDLVCGTWEVCIGQVRSSSIWKNISSYIWANAIPCNLLLACLLQTRLIISEKWKHPLKLCICQKSHDLRPLIQRNIPVESCSGHECPRFFLVTIEVYRLIPASGVLPSLWIGLGKSLQL
jgi:hypothetical protein